MKYLDLIDIYKIVYQEMQNMFTKIDYLLGQKLSHNKILKVQVCRIFSDDNRIKLELIIRYLQKPQILGN